jgi:YD repeat-containing protein
MGVIFTGRVRATGPKTQGPWSTVATGPYKTALTFAFDSQARLHTVTWTGGATQTFDFDGAGNLLSRSLAQ